MSTRSEAAISAISAISAINAPCAAALPPAPPGLRVVHAELARHGAGILALFNHAIAHTTALYEYQPRPAGFMAGWFEAKRAGGFPVLVLEDAASGALAGFASYGGFRPYAAFKYTVEHSVYIDAAHQGRGLGRWLLQALVAEAEQRGVHVMVGGIDAGNAASIALHRALGFQHAGTIAQAGYKFGRWLDLAFYQRTLTTPAAPVEG